MSRTQAPRGADDMLQAVLLDLDNTLILYDEPAFYERYFAALSRFFSDLFTPPELSIPGVERKLIEELKAKKVDRILLVNRPLQEYGSRGPGIDYAYKLMDFLAVNYILEQQIGGFPYADRKRGGAVLFMKKEPNPVESPTSRTEQPAGSIP